MRLKHVLLSMTLVLTTAGCSWFGGDDNGPEEIKPNPLPDINEEVGISVIWSRKIGGGADDRAVRIRPGVSGGRIFAAAPAGTVKALTTDTGRVIWEANVKDFYTKLELTLGFTDDLDAITGGVGVGGDLVVVGTGAGEIIALNQSDGSLAWKVQSSSEVLSAPQIDGDLVIVQSIDGKVAAYDAIDGERKWLYTTKTPVLTLRGTSTPIIADNNVIAGFASGRVVFLDRDRGLATIDKRVAVAEGITDLDRLVDIDGTMQITEGKIYVAAFQGRLIAIELGSGKIAWAEEVSSVEGVGTGFGNVYLSTTDSQLTAYSAENGRQIWNVDALLHRELTAPVTISSYVVVTDMDGYVHVLAQSDGRFVGRRKVDGAGIKAGVISEGGRLYAMGDSGSLSALEIR